MLSPSIVQILPKLKRNVDQARRAFNIWNRGAWQQGGYVHDTAMVQYIPPTLINPVTGTWTYAAGQVAHTIARHVAATAETSVVTIPVILPANSASLKGAYLKSIEIDYEVLVAACTSIDAVVYLVTRGANGAVATTAAPAFTYDGNHDTAAKRYAVAQHLMICNITAPFWLSNKNYATVELSCVKAASTTMDFLAAFANFTLRI